MKIIIAGGGTGGHIFPALAIANALKNKMLEMEILFVGAKGKMEMEKIPAAGFKIIGLDIAGYNRSSLIKNVRLPFKLVKSFLQVRKIIKAFKPDAVVGVGGYSTFPVLRYAQSKGIPSFIHESNSLPGRSNLILGKRATEIFVPSEGMEKYFPAGKIKVTGNPVRSIFLQKIPKEEALNFFGLKPGLKTVFVMGGSLGAKSINETIEENVDAFIKNDLQLIWQTGKNYESKVVKEEKNIWTNAFIDNMENAYSAADVVVARSGAMTVAEICMVGKPAIFVPYPIASEDHQTVNAMVLVNRKAALIVPDKKIKSELFPCLLKLINEEEWMKELGNNALKMSNKNADEMIATEIIKHIN